jgi:bacterial leucyl aminopeptidase
MQRPFLCGIFAFFTVSIAAISQDHFLLVPEWNTSIASRILPQNLEYFEDGISLLRVPIEKVEALSLAIHEEKGGCGGFIDVTQEIEEGQSPAQIVWNELRGRSQPSRHVSHEILGNPLVAQLVSRADAQKLWSFLQELTSFPDRSATTTNGKKASAFLRERADSLGKNLPGFQTRTISTGSSSYPQASVVASLPGLNPSLPRLVIGGHMDTFSNNKPGADDDASGSSVVMETLRAISVSGAQFERTIDFIWYAAEERGLVGSSNVVKSYKADGLAVEAVIQFDMVGWNDPKDAEDIYLMTDYTNSSLNSTLAKVIQNYTSAKIGYTACGYACSDHANWHRAGIPAVFPFESSFSNINQRMHTENDKMDYLSSSHVLTFAQVALGFLGELGNLKKIN